MLFKDKVLASIEDLLIDSNVSVKDKAILRHIRKVIMDSDCICNCRYIINLNMITYKGRFPISTRLILRRHGCDVFAAYNSNNDYILIPDNGYVVKYI